MQEASQSQKMVNALTDDTTLPLVDLEMNAAGVFLCLCQDFLKHKKEAR